VTAFEPVAVTIGVDCLTLYGMAERFGIDLTDDSVQS
jgi:hypothetical protein